MNVMDKCGGLAKVIRKGTLSVVDDAKSGVAKYQQRQILLSGIDRTPFLFQAVLKG